MKTKILPREFYRRAPWQVAPDLLGKILAVEDRDGQIRRLRINETEAYGDENDSGSHARFGKTKRTRVMFETVGHTYVYLIYGIYHLLNLTCHNENTAGAVLIRGAGNLDGPGKLTRFLQITTAQHHGIDATTGQKLWVEDDGFRPPPQKIRVTPRIGINYAKPKDQAKPWRFLLT